MILWVSSLSHAELGSSVLSWAGLGWQGCLLEESDSWAGYRRINKIFPNGQKRENNFLDEREKPVQEFGRVTHPTEGQITLHKCTSKGCPEKAEWQYRKQTYKGHRGGAGVRREGWGRELMTNCGHATTSQLWVLNRMRTFYSSRE